MIDVQDILELPNASSQEGVVTKESIIGEQKKKVKKAEPAAKKPEGMSREVYNLLVHDKNKREVPPLVPSITSNMGGYKNVKAKLGLRKVRPWKWTPFLNQGRKDSLKLCHWQRVEDDDKEYPFARFNKVLEIMQPTVDEFKSLDLADDDWSQEEIAHLFELCSRFDLIWPIVQDRFDIDRFPKRRSIEDLKEKFYSVSNKMIQVKTPKDEEPKLLNFDAEHERHRKQQLEKLWNRTEKQIEEEQFLMDELQKIEARKKERARKAKDLQKLISAVDRSPNPASLTSFNNSTSGGFPTMLPLQPSRRKVFRGCVSNSTFSIDSLNVENGAVVKFPEFKTSGAHLRSQQMKLPSSLGQKKLKAVDVALLKLGLESHPMATEDLVTQFNELRCDIMLLYELKSALSTCEFELESLKHQYQTITKQELPIPAHLRVTTTQEDDNESTETCSPFKRRISDALEVPTGPLLLTTVQKKKKTGNVEPCAISLRKLRKS